MNVKTKLLASVALLGFAVLIGYREVSTSCRSPAESGHSHGEGESEPEEGLGTRICEIGFFSALSEKVGLREPPMPVVSAPPNPGAKEEVGHQHGEKESDGHAHGDASDSHAKEPDGHEHGAEEAGHAHGPKEKGDEHGGGGGGHKQGEGDEGEGTIKLSSEQIAAAGIATAPVGAATLVKEVTVPGRIALNGDRQAKIVPKLTGTVASIDKQLGAKVSKGDLLATIESREVADAKSQFLEAWRAEELAKQVFQREERLWNQKVTAEQDFLNAKNAFETSKIQLELAHQKLHTMGLDEDDIDAVIERKGQEQAFRSYQIRSPIDGRVTARNLVLGQMLATDTEIFNIADLSTVWVDLAVQPADLPFARQGQEVIVTGDGRTAEGKVVALSPVIDPETRSARAIAEIDNSKGEWQPGDYVRAQLISGRQELPLVVPRDAIQTVNGKPSVFVAQDGGFKAHPVTTGKEDSLNVEIVSGLKAGEVIATKNTFALKAELGKSEAEHEH